MRRFLPCVVVVLLSGCLLHSPGPRRRQALAMLDQAEGERSLAHGQVERLALESPDPLVRRRAFVTLGRLQDPETTPALLAGLRDEDDTVRAEAAFAVGLLGLSWDPLAPELRPRLVAALSAAERSEGRLEVRLAEVEAMGRVGGEAAVPTLQHYLGQHPALAARAAVALGVALKNGVAAPPGIVEGLAPLLLSPDANVRFAATWALVQAKVPGRSELFAARTRDASAEVRGVAAKGLGDGEGYGEELLALVADPDAAVAAEAVRALLRQGRATCADWASCSFRELLPALDPRLALLEAGDTAKGAPPLLALAQAQLPPGGVELLHLVQGRVRLATVRAGPAAWAGLRNLDCRLAAALAGLTGRLDPVERCGDGGVPEAQRLAQGLEALAQYPAPSAAIWVDALAPYVTHAQPRVRRAALHALAGLKVPQTLELVRPRLSATDPVEVMAAVDVLASVGDQASVPALLALIPRVADAPDLAPTLAEALETLEVKAAVEPLRVWLGSPHASIRTAAAKALTHLEGHPVTARRVRREAGEPVDAPEPDTRLLLETARGPVEVRLFVDDAPRNASALVELAARGFFDGLTFHRVVPGFVAQGGDPRGDGEGGPGFTTPCELNHHRYTRGTVGMALSGKDTGGSQFFFTLAPQPHLDGRYTVVGEIVRGLPVADALLEGDRITRVTVLEP